MRFSPKNFLPAFIGFSLATLDASVYIFQAKLSPAHISTPTLSPEQARLVFTQRLGISDNYELGDAPESTLSYINQFGREQLPLFQDPGRQTSELVLIIEGLSTKTTQPILETWSSLKPDFYVSNISSNISSQLLPAEISNLVGPLENRLALGDVMASLDQADWSFNTKMIHIDLFKETDSLGLLTGIHTKLKDFAYREVINTVVILVSEQYTSRRFSGDRLEQTQLGLANKKRAVEEPIISTTLAHSPANQNHELKISKTQLNGVLPLCHKSLDICISSTKNCSGHGECLSKYGNRDSKGACFACSCRATNETVTWAKGTRKGWKISYWGGAACHKKDISSAFWLISVLTIVLIGIVTWGVGMLFSIGEEKLPGVIGAGVSNNKQRQG